jgi:hypothetical protein
MYALRGSRALFSKQANKQSSSSSDNAAKERKVITIEELLSVEDENIDEVVCRVCGADDREDKILLCDDCDYGYHMDTWYLLRFNKLIALFKLISCNQITVSISPALLAPPQEDDWFCSNCSQRPTLGTCWIPLGDLPTDHGVLAVLPGSQHLPNFDKYGFI